MLVGVLTGTSSWFLSTTTCPGVAMSRQFSMGLSGIVLEIYVQAERRSFAEAISLELALVATEPADFQYQNAQPQHPEQGSFAVPSMETVSPPNERSQCAQLQKPRRSTGPMHTMLVSLQMQRFSLVKVRMELQRPLTQLLIL